jgi:2-aminoadipate transaminase
MQNQVINLTRGVPPAEVFPISEIETCFKTALNRDGGQVLTYNFVPGYAPLRQILAERMGVPVDQIFTGNGSLEIVNFLSAIFLEQGDCAFTETPTYDRANTLFKRTGAEICGIPMESDGVDLNAMEAALKRRAPKLFYTITDFHNPLGTVTSLEKRKQVAKWADEYNFILIEDSPYRALRYKGEDLPTLYSMAPERAVHLGSVSKLLAPGLRVGWAMGSPQIMGRLVKWGIDSTLASPSPTQAIVYEYMRAGLFDINIERLKKVYAPRLAALASAIDATMPYVIYPKPEGGFFIGLTLPEGNRMDVLMQDAAAVGLKITDGRAFFTTPAEGERFLRIPFCTLPPDEIEEAVERLAGIVKRS